jgi:hypothetical protein
MGTVVKGALFGLGAFVVLPVVLFAAGSLLAVLALTPGAVLQVAGIVCFVVVCDRIGKASSKKPEESVR